jgi:hypothetical protein
MHEELIRTRNLSLYAVGLLFLATGSGSARGDDSGLLGRLFHLVGGSSSSSSAPDRGEVSPNHIATSPYSNDGGLGDSSLPSANLPATNSARSAAPTPALGPTTEGPTTPDLAGPPGPQTRVTPRPRVSTAITTVDPLLTKTALGRSNDGSQFGVFLQLFADGTVIDSEGVHHVNPSDLKPIVETIQSGELTRVRGHCGAPSTDYVENVHIVVFERRLGRLLAHSFSYSGNPQGCDHAVRHIHTALETLQSKLSRQPATTTPAAPAATGTATTLQPGSGPGVGQVPAISARPDVRPHASSNPASNLRPVPPLPNPGSPGSAAPPARVIPLTTQESQ